jgi:hypothetical protein
MKVLLVHHSSDLYGSDRGLLWIASAIQDHGDDVEIVIPFPGPLESELEKIKVPVNILDPIVFRRNLMNPADLARMSFLAGPRIAKLGRLIKKGNFDLVHTNTGVIVGSPIASRLVGVPHIWHFRELLLEFGNLWKVHEPYVVMASKKIICASNAVAMQFNSAAARKKIKVIHSAVPYPDPLEETPSGGDASKNGRPLRLLCTGRIAPYKSQDDLIEAVGHLRDRGLDVELILLGDVFGGQTDYLDSLKRQTTRLRLTEQVKFLGFREDVKPFLDAADICVMPSRRPEGLGLVVLEAMARGKPIVATKGGGVLDIIDNGRNGLLVPPGDPVAMSRAIEELALDADRRRTMGLMGHATVAQHFTVKQMTDRILAEYKKVLAA